ncbi:MAG: GNAT family N-acetyltransferase [Alcanivoracaceae bacterium]|nr:GNAT family N-acetyltransferase [Alcanivoracaceae bacterium]
MLRLVKKSDLETIFTIYMHEAVIPYMSYEPMSIQSFIPIFNELVDSQSFLVLTGQSGIKGFCRVNRHKGRAAHVVSFATLAIAPEQIGTGLAEKFIKMLFDSLQKEGIFRVELKVEEDNPRAIAFYKKMGFLHEGTMRLAFKRSTDDHYIDHLFLGKVFK